MLARKLPEVPLNCGLRETCRRNHGAQSKAEHEVTSC